MNSMGVGALALVMAGCGGGGGSDAPTPAPPPSPPVAVPSSITVSAPEQADWQAAVTFDSSAATAAAGWRYDWRFGDGASSSEVRPQHSYAGAGEYTVALTITDGQGGSVTASKKLTVQAWANLRNASCSRPGLGGWCRIGVDAAAPSVGAVFMAGATQAWASTAFGDLWQTRDAGKTWQRASTSAPNGVTGIYFQDAVNGWLTASPGVLGADNAVVWHTSDGGASFSPLLPDWPASGYQVYVLGGNKLMARSQSSSTLLGSVDGGVTWRTNPADRLLPWTFNQPILPPAQRSGRVWRVNGSTVEVSDDAGFTVRTASMLPAACSFGTSLNVMSVSPSAALVAVFSSVYVPSSSSTLNPACYSTDGGTTWTEAAPGLVQPGYAFGYPVSFIGDTGIVLRDGKGLLLSNPVGSPWQRVNLDRTFDPLLHIGVVDSTHLWIELASGTSVFNSRISGPQTLFTAGGQPTDAQSWAGFVPTFPDLTRNYQYGVQSTIGEGTFNQAFDAKRGLQLSRGKLYLTEDNGASFTAVNLSGPEPVQVGSSGAGAFLNVKQGLVVSAQQTLLQSDDGGKTWAASTTLPAGQVYDVWTGPEQSLWVSGYLNDQGATENRLVRSLDGGKTWTSVFKGMVKGVQFIGRSQGWLYTDAQVFKSSDFGQTWQGAGALGTTYMQMLDASHGVAGYTFYAGSNSPAGVCIRTTEDGGATWTACASPQGASGAGMSTVTAGASGFWLANGNGLYRSNDFGKTWTAATLSGPAAHRGRINQVAFADAQRGWAVSALGGIWTTGDGGQTWDFQATPSSANLRRLSIVDARAVWAFGVNTILGTATGGQ